MNDEATVDVLATQVNVAVAESAESQAIQELYNHLAALRESDGYDQELIDKLMVDLRVLQTAEATSIRSRFESSLSMPIDAGRRALDAAKSLIAKCVHPQNHERQAP